MVSPWLLAKEALGIWAEVFGGRRNEGMELLPGTRTEVSRYCRFASQQQSWGGQLQCLLASCGLGRWVDDLLESWEIYLDSGDIVEVDNIGFIRGLIGFIVGADDGFDSASLCGSRYGFWYIDSSSRRQRFWRGIAMVAK